MARSGETVASTAARMIPSSGSNNEAAAFHSGARVYQKEVIMISKLLKYIISVRSINYDSTYI